MKGSVHENVMFEAKTARPGKEVAAGNLFGGGEGYESKVGPTECHVSTECGSRQ